MPIEIINKFENQRLGISFLGLKNFSIGRDLERSIDLIQSEMDRIHTGVSRRIVENFEYLKKKRELHLSMIVEVPINTKKLVLENGKVDIQEQTYYYPRNIDAIVSIEQSYIVIFDQSQKEIKEFAEYLRELTVFKLNPVYVKLNNKSMRDMLKNFETIQRLKIVIGSEDSIRFIKCSGSNVLGYTFIAEILSNEKNEVAEIGGILSSSHENRIKVHLNNKGRLQIYTNPDKVYIESIYNIMEDLERMILESDLYKNNKEGVEKNE